MWCIYLNGNVYFFLSSLKQGPIGAQGQKGVSGQRGDKGPVGPVGLPGTNGTVGLVVSYYSFLQILSKIFSIATTVEFFIIFYFILIFVNAPQILPLNFWVTDHAFIFQNVKFRNCRMPDFLWLSWTLNWFSQNQFSASSLSRGNERKQW